MRKSQWKVCELQVVVNQLAFHRIGTGDLNLLDSSERWILDCRETDRERREAGWRLMILSSNQKHD